MIEARAAVSGAALTALVLALGGLAGCAAKPTEEDCRSGIKHMMEVQIDEMPQAAARAGMPIDNMGAGPNGETPQQMLKSRIDLLLTPAAVSQCVERTKKADMRCTLTANTTDDLIKRCHWKVLPGGKLGY